MTLASIARNLRWAALGVLLAAAIIALFLEPAHAFAADPSAPSITVPGAGEGASDGPGDQPPSGDPGGPDDGQGEVVIDGPFVTPTPEGTVAAAIGAPHLTPPPTDAARPSRISGGDAIRTPLAVLAAISLAALATSRPGVRSRSASPARRTTPVRRTRP